MADPTTINANVAHCLKSMTHAGFTRVHNICTGSAVDVPWGLGDWILGGVLFATFAATTVMMTGLAFAMWRDA